MRGRRILLVDDEPEVCWSLRDDIAFHGLVVEEAFTGTIAMDAISNRGPFDAVLLDYDLSDMCGLEVLDYARQVSPATPVIMMTGVLSVPAAVLAIKRGALDFTTKPIDVDALRQTIESTLRSAEMDGRARATSRLIGSSAAMQELRCSVERVAASPVSTVLLTGESGTGKGLVARAIHEASPRRRHLFVDITCSAFNETELEIEIFGHEAGAPAPAVGRRRGLLEIADGGTVFVDEIAEMAPVLQAKFSRFLEERAFRRVGGTRDIHVDVRVIAATNRSLPVEVAQRRLREDLFYRLRAVALRMPPLREHREDIEALAIHFLNEFNANSSRSLKGMLDATMEQLMLHDWPGNVRELKHSIEQAALLAEGDYLTPEGCDLAPRGVSARGFVLPPEGVVLADIEQSLVMQALEATRWNQARAGRLLGLNRAQIRYRMEKFGIAQRERKIAEG